MVDLLLLIWFGLPITGIVLCVLRCKHELEIHNENHTRRVCLIVLKFISLSIGISLGLTLSLLFFEGACVGMIGSIAEGGAQSSVLFSLLIFTSGALGIALAGWLMYRQRT